MHLVRMRTRVVQQRRARAGRSQRRDVQRHRLGVHAHVCSGGERRRRQPQRRRPGGRAAGSRGTCGAAGRGRCRAGLGAGGNGGAGDRAGGAWSVADG